MAGLLEGHLAVITGASSGIGRAIAEGYAREGARIVALDQNLKGAEETCSLITKAGGTATAHELDVTDRAACRAVAAKVSASIGKVSVLVNNAGITRRNPFTSPPEVADADWDTILSINLDGVYNVTHAFIEDLRATKGRIVNIGSIQSFVHVRTPSAVAYTTSKHGVLGLTRALAAELGKDGVRVNAIGPGFIESPLNEKARANMPELVRAFVDHTPLARTGKPADIVGPAVFLASDMSSYVTGSMVTVDGGYRTV
ncbi:MAG TPA: SDR family oxidoreductase [Hyphomicrobiaceae bacterium]|nr:SDR family oxidoreductase [Hyphomicrobiaceae bacterium]